METPEAQFQPTESHRTELEYVRVQRFTIYEVTELDLERIRTYTTSLPDALDSTNLTYATALLSCGVSALIALLSVVASQTVISRAATDILVIITLLGLVQGTYFWTAFRRAAHQKREAEVERRRAINALLDEIQHRPPPKSGEGKDIITYPSESHQLKAIE